MSEAKLMQAEKFIRENLVELCKELHAVQNYADGRAGVKTMELIGQLSFLRNSAMIAKSFVRSAAVEFIAKGGFK